MMHDLGAFAGITEHDFADDLRGPDPRDRFPWFFAAILAAAVICAAFGWRWV